MYRFPFGVPAQPYPLAVSKLETNFSNEAFSFLSLSLFPSSNPLSSKKIDSREIVRDRMLGMERISSQFLTVDSNG